ncbi:MAG: alginate lyase family protein [Ignavibacteria bacterium]|nr:alginate lyase family protein [Ignavibacteria bacterium]
MTRTEQVSIFFWSIIHLRPAMIYWRVHRAVKGALLRRFARMASAQRFLDPPVATIPHRTVPFLAPVVGCEEIDVRGRIFTFLNDRCALPADRDARRASIADKPLLWQFHYGYHDYLPALLRDGHAGMDDILAFVAEWNGDFPLLSEGSRSAAWHPYVLSIRIESWIRLHAAVVVSATPEGASQLLAQGVDRMTRVLLRNMEYGTMANHLLRNVKALVLAGLFLQNVTGARALRRGMKLLLRELAEQVLDDGMHYERAPMYHVAMTSDVLDLVEALDRTAQPVPAALLQAAARMTGFLGHILHPDGDVPYMNDSTASAFLQPRDVLARGERLCRDHGLQPGDPRPTADMLRRPQRVSGLLVHRAGDLFVVFDGGPVGPDYQPGHAHCDTLSYEVSWKGRRLISDTGVFHYRESPERTYARSTAAHNTVRLDSRDQSEVWKSFRVGRRAGIIFLESREEHGCTIFHAAHDGYERFGKGLIHERCMVLRGDAWLVVIDFIHGSGRHLVENMVHFAPDIALKRDGHGVAILAESGRCSLQPAGGENVRVFETECYPAFGVSVLRKTVVQHAMAELPLTTSYTLQFGNTARNVTVRKTQGGLEILEGDAPVVAIISRL